MAGNTEITKRLRFPVCRDALLWVGMSRTKTVSSYSVIHSHLLTNLALPDLKKRERKKLDEKLNY